jgi:hypothetical protein
MKGIWLKRRSRTSSQKRTLVASMATARLMRLPPDSYIPRQFRKPWLKRE